MIHLVALDLAEPQRNAARLGEWLKRQFPDWAEPVPHLWVVDGPLAAEQIRVGLAPFLDARDRVLIVKAGTETVWQGMADDVARWLADHFPGSVTERIPGATEGVARD